MGTVHEAQIFFVYQQFQASFSCERRVWRLFSPDSWCLLKPNVNLNSLLFCKITDSPFLVSHTFLCFANIKPRGFLRSQGMADWFGTGFLKPVIAKMTRVKLLWFTYNQVVVSKMDPKFTPKHRKNWYTRACTYRIKLSPIVQELQGRHCCHYHYSWRFLVCGWLTRNQKAGVTGLLLAFVLLFKHGKKSL